MVQQFKNMNELVDYLGVMEQRIQFLEQENRQLRSATAATANNGNIDERTIAKYVATFLPLTNIVHPSFLKRAFAVWGHYFVAQLIISLPFMLIYFCLIATLLNGAYPRP